MFIGIHSISEYVSLQQNIENSTLIRKYILINSKKENMTDITEKVLKEVVENATDNISAAKIPASPEGAVMAYGSLIVMAMLPIFFGALRSVKHQKDQKVNLNVLITIRTSFETNILLISIIRILAKNWSG